MAGAGFKDFQAGEKLFAADVDNYLMQQAVMRFANSAARSSAIGTAVAEGMVSYLDDTNSVEVYNGSSWTSVSPSYLTTGTAGYTALSNGTAGISYQPVSHNYIINGAFDIWQRGTSQTTTGFGCADRWYNSVGGTTTFSQSTDVPAAAGVQYSLKWETSASSSFGQFYYALERGDVIPLRGKELVFSFYVKSAGSMAGNIVPSVKFSNSTDALTSVTSAVTATGDTLFAASTVTDWTRKQIVFTVPSDAIGLRLQILPGSTQASGVSCLITGVQLEAGSVATPFKRHAPSLQGELAACQRYFERLGATSSESGSPLSVGFATSTTVAKFKTNGLVKKRVSPTVSFKNNTDFRVWDGVSAAPTTTAMSVVAGSVDFAGNLEITATVSSGLTQYRPVTLIPQNAVETYIDINAEL